MERFSDKLADTFLMAASWGGYESLMIPTCAFYVDGKTETHLPFTFVRFYVGLEDEDYLRERIDRALEEL